MPHASTQQPATTAPLRPLWYAKDVRHPFPGITRVVVPLAGGPPSPDAEARLTEALERRWVMPPAGRPYANAIAVSIDAEPRAMDGRAYWLVLVISTSENCAPLHIDRMARHLRVALTQRSTTSGAAPHTPTSAPDTAPPSAESVRNLLAPPGSQSGTAGGEILRTSRVTRLHHAQEAIRAARSRASRPARPNG